MAEVAEPMDENERALNATLVNRNENDPTWFDWMVMVFKDKFKGND